MLRVMDAPGYYAAFPWGVTRGKGGDRNAQQRRWRTRSIFPSLSPRIFHAWSFIRPRRQLTEQYTEGLHPEPVSYTHLTLPTTPYV